LLKLLFAGKETRSLVAGIRQPETLFEKEHQIEESPLVSWNVITLARNNCGLGMRMATKVNYTLLGNLVWELQILGFIVWNFITKAEIILNDSGRSW
jgi:hypothetical protein